MKDALKLILVTNKQDQPISDYLEFIKICATSGITSVQLREKTLSGHDLLLFGQKLKKLLDALNIPLIVNDNIELCLKLNAYGLHLGQSDGNIQKAKELLGPNKILGLSTNNLEQIKIANNLPVDYLGVGSIFPTRNKPNIETIWGINNLKEAYKISKYPIVAIGGINNTNAKNVLQTGAYGIAAIEAFHNQNSQENCQNLRRIVDERKYA
ncbi:thiamine phosphate synthase [Pseudofrancisella aestuarii]|uniref:Thiamine-phosphate synthase n=1 Tax=Pseudofrancisella aestuarii TaxID=2670347 RepID=A0ABV9TD46_9GAMM|nr:thiamine phosphate synthase [Pseudofrancisella aestuarii]